jgi:hypothetical protein
MLAQVREGDVEQVHLHSIVVMSALSMGPRKIQSVRSLVHEAQALFDAGNQHLAEQRLQEAIERWEG